MASVLSHAVAALAIGACFYQPGTPKRVWVVGARCSVIPDLDVIGFHFGVAYADIDGHRGLLHSLAFALLLAELAAIAARPLRTTRGCAFVFVLVCAASHGLLDMMTTGGLGVAWFWPFSDARHFLPWQVIKVSPLTFHRLLSPVGRAVMVSELQVVWIPAALLCLMLLAGRRLRNGLASR